MPRGRLLPEKHSHRSTGTRRAGAVASAGVVTTAAVVVGVMVPGAAPEEAQVTTSASSSVSGELRAVDLQERTIGTSRSTDRVPAVQVQARTPEVTGKLWTSSALRLRVQPQESARGVGTFPDDQRIAVTGKRQDGYAEVVVDDRARWVSVEYLSKKRQPQTGVDAGVDAGPCPNGVSASGGLQPQAQSVMNAVCNAFPEISTYGGYAPRGEHGGGMAVDIMVSGSLGDQVAEFLHSHRGELGLSNIIWSRTIWSSERDGEGFRGMEDRGSTTANHYDHVHVLAG